MGLAALARGEHQPLSGLVTELAHPFLFCYSVFSLAGPFIFFFNKLLPFYPVLLFLFSVYTGLSPVIFPSHLFHWSLFSVVSLAPLHLLILRLCLVIPTQLISWTSRRGCWCGPLQSAGCALSYIF